MTVLADVPHLVSPLTYSWPERLGPVVEPGSVVRVPLHGRYVRGWLVSTGDDGERYPGQIKEVQRVVGAGPRPEIVAFCAEVAEQYLCSPVVPLRSASSSTPTKLPARVVERDGGAGEGRGSRFEPFLPELSKQRTLLWVSPDGTLARETLRIVLSVVRSGRSVIVVAPTLERVRELSLVVKQAGLDPLDFRNHWGEIRRSTGPVVVVGGRSSIAASVPHLGAVIVLDGQDRSHRDQRRPYAESSELARLRCELVGAYCVDISVAPRLEMVRSSNLARVAMPSSTPSWARIDVVERTTLEQDSELIARFNPPSLCSSNCASRGGRHASVAVVINRKGFARRVRCRRCHERPLCEDCHVPLIGGGGVALETAERLEALRERSRLRYLQCPSCRRRYPPLCFHCGSPDLQATSKGTTKVAIELEGVLSQPIVDLSRSDSAAFSPGSVVVGTEAVLLGSMTAHRVVFLDFDQLLWGPEVDTTLHAAYLLARASEATVALGGSVMVMTSARDGLVLRCGRRRSLDELYRLERDLRRELELPPYRDFARVRRAEVQELVVEHEHELLEVGIEVIVLNESVLLLAAPTRQTLLVGLTSVFERSILLGMKLEFGLRSP